MGLAPHLFLEFSLCRNLIFCNYLCVIYLFPDACVCILALDTRTYLTSDNLTVQLLCFLFGLFRIEYMCTHRSISAELGQAILLSHLLQANWAQALEFIKHVVSSSPVWYTALCTIDTGQLLCYPALQSYQNLSLREEVGNLSFLIF